jgi:hypothetical protein
MAPHSVEVSGLDYSLPQSVADEARDFKPTNGTNGFHETNGIHGLEALNGSSQEPENDPICVVGMGKSFPVKLQKLC